MKYEMTLKQSIISFCDLFLCQCSLSVKIGTEEG